MKTKVLTALFCFYVLVNPLIPETSGPIAVISEDYWKNQLEESSYLRLKFGLPVDRLPDLTYEHAKDQTSFANGLLERLKKIDPANLSYEDWLSHQILTWDNERNVEAFQYFWLTNAITPYASPLSLVHRVFTEHTFHTNADLAHYIALLKQYAPMILQIQKHLEEQLKQNIVIPQEEVKLVMRFISSFGAKSNASLFAVDEARLEKIAQQESQTFRMEVASIIDTEIAPAVKNLETFLSGVYLTKAPQAVGVSQYPRGKDYYRFLVRYHTTMDVSPEAIHRIGLEETARIEREMEKVRLKSGYQGSKSEFQQYLKTDPRFFPKSAEEAGAKLMSYIHKIEPIIGQYFSKTPRAPYGVRRLDPSLEGSMTFGYYQEPTKADPKGYYFYNGSNLNQRSLLNAGSLIYHELVPGHHFQMALQSENTKLPSFRRNSYSTAYVEGWADYSSELAGELGMYEDPYDQYGRHSMDMFLTTRLVVDTGMNDLGWSRAKAIDYMKERLLVSDTEIQTETLRYSCDIPGQALAYKMGSKKILELRNKAKQALGDKFDMRLFHDLILSSGSMPMSVLEQHVDRFIKTQRTQSN